MTAYHPNGTTEQTETAERTAERLRAGATDTLNDVQDRLNDVQDRASAAAQDVEKAIEGSVNSAAQFVRANPGVALTGAVGLGIVIGLSLGNRR